MNVALYMRYSSDRQTEQSIEGQERVCRAFCEREGHQIVAVYIDRATSAFKDTDKRTQFQAMIRDASKNLFSAVVVYKLDRFARNRYDSATYKAKLKKAGVRVISATENISDNPEGVILEAVLEGMAEFYSLELSQKINRGMHESALKAHSTGGQIPLGYKIVNKQYVIDEAAAQIVREAFDLYASGMTIEKMVEVFNSKGYRSSKGYPFSKTSFKAILRNEKYIGVYRYADVRIEDAIPAIIDKDTFAVVQKRIAENNKAPARGKAKVDYLLSGKLFCGHCGSKMISDGGVSKTGRRYYYYTCATRKHKNACNKKLLRKEWIERVVAEKTLEKLTPDLIDELADAAVKVCEEDMANNKVIPALEAEIADANRRRNNLMLAMEEGGKVDIIVERVKEWGQKIADLEKRLAKEKSELVLLEKDHFVWFLSQFATGDIEDEAFRRRLIDLLVNSVTVWDEPDGGYKITIFWNLNDVPQETISATDDLNEVRINDITLHHSPQIRKILVFEVTFKVRQTA